jgi:hypothetical protein
MVVVAAEVMVATTEAVVAMATAMAATTSMVCLLGLHHLHGARRGGLAGVRLGLGPLAPVFSALACLLLRPTRPINP